MGIKSLRSISVAVVVTGLVGLASAVLVLAQALVGFDSVGQGARRALVAKDVVADVLPPPLYLIELRLVLSQAVEQSMPIAQAESELRRLKTEYADRVAHWSADKPFGLESRLLGEQHRAGERFIAAADGDVMAALRKGDVDAARVALARAHEIYVEHRRGVDRTVEEANAMVTRETEGVAQAVSRARWSMTATATVLMLAMFGCALWALRTVVGPVRSIAQLLEAVAKGRLSVEVRVSRRDDLGRLQAATATMVGQLRAIVGRVRNSAESVAAATTSIADGEAELIAQSERQAVSVQQATASMAQLGDTVRGNADSARLANELATGANAITGQAGAVVRELIETMHGIDESSRRIADIIGVIDGIAFQTNILALNAAVEAARAGESGRGFAVVASEVRQLARRSGEAAREIRELITASVERVQNGSGLVGQAGATMNEVVQAIENVAHHIGSISAATAGQDQAVASVISAMHEIELAMKRYSELIRTNAVASRRLHDEAGQLVKSVAVFELG